MATTRKTGEHYVDENGNYRLVSSGSSGQTYNEKNNYGAGGTEANPTGSIKVPDNVPTMSYEESNYGPSSQQNNSKVSSSSYGSSGSGKTNSYRSALKKAESSKPSSYVSNYSGEIDSILDSIMNRESFDVSTNDNYLNLYNQYAQQYQANASKAMRDAMGQSAGLTGGYGSTYAQAAGSQAYDNVMQGLNSQNINLMNLAYGMYEDEQKDRYNQLSAVQGLDNTDYSRYRDTYNDWLNDRNYYANRYDNEQSQLNYEDETAYKRQQDADQSYTNALTTAAQYAASGVSVPDQIAAKLGMTVDEANAWAEEYVAKNAKKSASGSGSAGSAQTSASTIGSMSAKDQQTTLKLLQHYADLGMRPTDELKNAMGWSDEQADKWYNDYTGSDGLYKSAKTYNQIDVATKRASIYANAGYDSEQIAAFLLKSGFTDQEVVDAIINISK